MNFNMNFNTNANNINADWYKIKEWLLYSPYLMKYVKDYLIQDGSDTTLYMIAKTHNRNLSKDYFSKHMIDVVSLYKGTKVYVLQRLEYMRDKDGYTILHAMAKVNAIDHIVYEIINRYCTKSLWLMMDKHCQTPLHVLITHHSDIAYSVFKYVYEKDVRVIMSQDCYGNTPIHIFFMKISDFNLQLYLLDTISEHKVPEYVMKMMNNFGQTPYMLYNLNHPWYLYDQQLKKLQREEKLLAERKQAEFTFPRLLEQKRDGSIMSYETPPFPSLQTNKEEKTDPEEISYNPYKNISQDSSQFVSLLEELNSSFKEKPNKKQKLDHTNANQ